MLLSADGSWHQPHFYWIVQTAPLFFGDRLPAVQCTEHYRALGHFHHRWCVPGMPSQWHRRGEKKGVGHYLPFASSMCFILSGNSKLACVSRLLVGKIFLGYAITSSPRVITGIRDPRRWMVLCLSGLHVDEAVPEPTVLINNVCLYWADNWIWNVGMG